MITRLEVDLDAPASRPTLSASDVNLALGLASGATDVDAGQRDGLIDAAFSLAEGEVRYLWGRRDFTTVIETEGAVKVLPGGGWRPFAASVSSAELVDGDRSLSATERTLDAIGRLTLPDAGLWRLEGEIGEDITASGWTLPNAVKEAVLRVAAFYLREGYLRTLLDGNVPLNVSGAMNKSGAALFLREFRRGGRGLEWWPA